VSRRLSRSVVRPLNLALGGEPESGLLRDPAPKPISDLSEELWQLARKATELSLATKLPPEVREATAALQDLALRGAPGRAVDAAKLAELQRIQQELPGSIRLVPNGPYVAVNIECLTNWLGERMTILPQMALCRCGASAMKPFCDGSHAEIGFTDAKDPNHVPDQRDEYVGLQVTILDNRAICQHSGFCTDRLSTVFHLGKEPFVTPSGGRMDEIIRAVRDCPSGALSFAIDGHEAREAVDHGYSREPNIEVSKDGPYRIAGSIRLLDGEDRDVKRNQGASLEHYALCRCGQSRNKPFCSGMHWYVDFKDPVQDPDREPTIFEWAGGIPALTRMTRIFYEKYVPQDPLLSPLFSEMSADHPQRVAKWLGEVFCGPKYYSQEYGGYPRMLSQHIGKGITEEHRVRWVHNLLQAATDAGLPNDPEFRSVFSSYIEWGSRLAVENSQPGWKPPQNMPMPHWDWLTAAGPPGSRIGALPPQAEEEEEAPVTLPGPDETVSFDAHIKPLFRSQDRRSMSFAFDLWAYAEVKEHASAILTRLSNGSMPCDGGWPQERIGVFRRWVESGMEA
jgi:CDGSH-type Zn-finger protein/truncated hemoglobin YjbI